jgi:thioredoxin-like negative regulator of GroEL
MLSSTIASIKDDIPFEIVEVDIDEHIELAAKFNVRSVPTMIVVDEHDTVIKRVAGSMPAAEVKKFLGV